MRTFEELIVDGVARLRAAPVTADDFAAVQDVAIDTIACAVGGCRSDLAEAVLRYARDSGSTGNAELWFKGGRMHPFEAGLVNGVASRYLDFNDTYLGRVEGRHPSDCIPVLWAMAQSEGRSFGALSQAILLAYEVDCALADSVSLSREGIDNVFFGGIAAAIGTGVLLGLDRTQMIAALRIVACMALAPNKIRFGELSSWKAVAGPWAARCAAQAAVMARAGLTGPDDVFAGKAGIWSLLQSDANNTANPLSEWTGTYALHRASIKLHPIQFHAQSAVECAIRLHQRGIGALKRVVVDTYQVAHDTAVADAEKWQPKTRETADHSLPCCVAMALAQGRVDVKSFSDEQWARPDVARVMSRMQVRIDPAMTADYPAQSPCRIAITTEDGREFVEETRAPGGYGGPAKARRMIDAKFTALASDVIGGTRAAAVLERLRGLRASDGIPGLDAA